MPAVLPYTPANTASAPAPEEPVKMTHEKLIRRTLLNANNDATAFLQGVPLFKRLPVAEIPTMAQAMDVQTFQAGETVFRQGDKGDAFYVIFKGVAEVCMHEQNYLKVNDEVRCLKDLHFGGKRVIKGSTAVVDKFDASRDFPYTIRVVSTGLRGRVLPEEVERVSGPPEESLVATLREGDFFGEQSLLRGANRAATIVAVNELTCFRLTRERFKTFHLGSKLEFATRKAVVAVSSDDANTDSSSVVSADGGNKNYAKTEEELKIFQDAIRKNRFLGDIIDVSEEQVSQLANAAYTQEGIKKGEVLIEQGEIFAEKFYVVQEGVFQFSKKNDGGKSEIDSFLGEATIGSSFGELALLYNTARAATVKCNSDNAKVWVIERSTFKNILQDANKQKEQELIKVIDSVPLFGVLTNQERSNLVDACVHTNFEKEKKILVQGERGTAFYILTQGEIRFEKDGAAAGTMKVDAGEPAKWFGERALLEKDEVRQATAIVASAEAKCLAITRNQFETILGPLKDLMKKEYQPKEKEVAALPQRPKADVHMEDLKRMGLLGCGGFGAVTLEKHMKTGKLYALKALSKGYVVKMKMQKGVIREKEILFMCDSRFVVKLYQTFKTKEHLYFLMEPALGGELFATYHKKRFHGSTTRARFYSASVVLAFEHLHERKILYRDLKPENLLLDVKGFCKLTDMGLAKVLTTTKTYTVCGTPDYFAPEVIKQCGMNKAVDWWTLGILIYELLSGNAPFEARDPMETYQKVVQGVSTVKFPFKDRDPDAVHLVQNLLRHTPSERLPMRAGGTENIRKHQWYRPTIDWDKLFNHEMKPPYIPDVRGNGDMSNFRAQEAELPPQIAYKDPGTGWEDNF